MKKILAILLVFAITVPLFSSCNKDESPAETTAPDTTKIEESKVRESKAYPNALTVSTYFLLTSSEKIIYEAIAKLISSPEPSKSITIKQSVKNDTFNMVIDIFKGNFATHSAVIEKISFRADDDNITAVMIADDFDAESFKKEYDIVNRKADEIISNIPLGLSEKEIVFELVDYLITNTELLDDNESTTIHNALIEGKADSEGFAKAFDLLLKKSGISSFTVYGYEEEYIADTASSGHKIYKIPEVKHYWNYLCLWNKWYVLDISHLYSFWCDGGEMLLDIDNLNGYNGLPYYYYKGSMDNMKVPITSSWSDSVNEFSSANEIIELLKSFDLYNIWQKSIFYQLNVKLKTDAEVVRFLDYNRKSIKDKADVEYILYLRQQTFDPKVVSITVIKNPDKNFTPFFVKTITLNTCHEYKENCDFYELPSIIGFEPINVSYSVPDYWLETNGFDHEYRRFIDSEYPGFTHAMNFMNLIKLPEGFIFNEETTENLNISFPYMGEYFNGTTSKGNKYSYYTQPSNYEGEIFYYVYVQVSDEYVVRLYITESNAEIALKVIDSIHLLENS